MTVAEKIANLRAWLAHGSIHTPYAQGAAVVLDEIAAAHADILDSHARLLTVNAALLAACEFVRAHQCQLAPCPECYEAVYAALTLAKGE